MSQEYWLAHGPMRGSAWDAEVSEDAVEVAEYPFRGFVCREEAKKLRAALGFGARRGGAILVTGYRGSGKTSAVNKALYDAALLGRGLPDQLWEHDGELSDADALGALDTAARSEGPVKLHPASSTVTNWFPTAVIEIPINLAYPITPDALTRRIVRQLYWGLVRAGVVGLAPGLVATARLACLRTAGRFKEVESETLKETLQNSLKVTLGGKSGGTAEAGASAAQEIAIARSIALEFNVSTKEEMDEELLKLLEEVDGSVYGAGGNLWDRLGRLMDWVNLKRIGQFFGGAEGVRFNLVFLLDELDKLEFAAEAVPAETGLPADLPTPGSLELSEVRTHLTEPTGTPDGTTQTRIERGPRAQTLTLSPELQEALAGTTSGAREDTIQSVWDVARAIKPILASGRATFVVIGGPKDARRWHEEEGRPRDLLAAVFSDYVHFGLMTAKEAGGLLPDRLAGAKSLPAPTVVPAGGSLDLLSGWLIMECVGAYTRAISVLRGLARDQTNAQELLKRPETWPRALLGLAVDALVLRVCDPHIETVKHLDPYLRDAVCEPFLLLATGEIEATDAQGMIEELSEKERRVDHTRHLSRLSVGVSELVGIANALEAWSPEAKGEALPAPPPGPSRSRAWDDLEQVWHSFAGER